MDFSIKSDETTQELVISVVGVDHRYPWMDIARAVRKTEPLPPDYYHRQTKKGRRRSWICMGCCKEYDIATKHKYCPECGQRIKWEVK